MDDIDLLKLQIQTTLDELGQVERWIERWSGAAAAEGRLRTRVRQGFALQIQDREGELEALLGQVSKNSLSSSLAWSRLRDHRRATYYLFQESLAFLQGVLAREAGLDHGLCAIADALLDDLSDRCGIPWERFTIAAEGEFFQDMVGIIRLRFPDTSIWSLPIAVHEFGHYVAQEMRVRVGGQYEHPFQKYLEEQGAGDRRRINHLNEHFADLFATYVLGPAYAFTCLLLRFDPAAGDSATHPSSARRAHLILRLLEEMSTRRTLPEYADCLSWIEPQWAALLQSSGQDRTLSKGDRDDLEQLFARNVVLLNRNLLDEARYSRWGRAKTLAGELTARVSPSALEATDTLVEVLNAAWYRRMSNWSASQEIGRAALVLCRHLSS